MGQRIEPKEIIVFVDESDNEPYTEWINSLKDKTGAQRIKSRLRRLEAGHYGDCSSVGDGVLECKTVFWFWLPCLFWRRGGKYRCFIVWWR